MGGLLHQYYYCDAFRARVPQTLNLIECIPYAEMEDNDSLRAVLQRTG